jgi:hypothetical protein
VILHSLTITGANTKVPLSSGSPAIAGYTSPNSLQCKWVQLVASGAGILLGGAEVTASVGFPLASGAGQFTAPIAIDTDFYDLSNMFAYVPNGTTLYVLYGG